MINKSGTKTPFMDFPFLSQIGVRTYYPIHLGVQLLTGYGDFPVSGIRAHDLAGLFHGYFVASRGSWGIK